MVSILSYATVMTETPESHVCVLGANDGDDLNFGSSLRGGLPNGPSGADQVEAEEAADDEPSDSFPRVRFVKKQGLRQGIPAV